MSRYMKIGMLVTFSVIGAVVFMLQTAESVSKGDSVLVSAYLQDATGLLPESKVRINGVVVGNVKDIVLDQGQARVDMEISRDVPLYEDAAFEKRMESLLGTASVSLTPGTPTRAKLAKGAVIRKVRSGTAMEETLANLEEVSTLSMGLTEEIVGQLTGQAPGEGSQVAEVAEAYQVLLSSMKNINAILANMEGISGSVNENSDQSLRQFNQLITSLNDLTANLNQMTVQNESRVQNSLESINRSLASLAAQMEASQQILAKVESITTSIEEGEGNIGKLMKDDKLYNQVISLTAKAEETIESTIGIDLMVDYQSDYLVNQQAGRNQVGLRLKPGNKNKYYSVGIVNAPNTGTTTTTTTTEGGSAPVTTTETVSGWTPYLQLAYIYGPFTLRGGLIEGAGGFGLDYTPVNFANLSVEAFDFDPIQQPRLRIGSTIQPFFTMETTNPLSWIYLSGGVDDILGQSQMDYYLGAGLRFQDNDLKGIASFVPFSP